MGKKKREPAEHDIKRKMEDFRIRCHETGLKVTPQRTEVYQALLRTNEHPSAETVFRSVRKVFPSISLDTVNRALLTLTDMGLAFTVEGSGEAKRYDANLENHQHFKCVNCRQIVDFHFEPFDRIDVPKCVRGKFTVLRKTVYFEGLCERCRKQQQQQQKQQQKKKKKKKK